MTTKSTPVNEKKFPTPEEEDAMIREVNARYNKLITYKNEPRDDGKPGYGGWQLYNLPDGGEGDCDTYARTKGEALVKGGVPQSKLHIVTARLWDGTDHAMLRVDRGNGKFVYLTNPMNDMQRNHPDTSILEELPGKPIGAEYSYPMWGALEKIYRIKRGGASTSPTKGKK